MFAPLRKLGWRADFPALAAVLVLLASLLPFSDCRGEEAKTVPVEPDMSGAVVPLRPAALRVSYVPAPYVDAEGNRVPWRNPTSWKCAATGTRPTSRPRTGTW